MQRLGCVMLLAWATLLAIPGSARTQTAGAPGTRSQVRDDAHLFSAQAVDDARARLRDLEARTRLATVIETVASLGGDSPAAVLNRTMKRANQVGLFVLISGKEKHLEVRPSPALAIAWPQSRLDAVRDGFLSRFRTGNLDDGLREGVKAIAAIAESSVVKEAILPVARIEPAATGNSLVIRNQVRLTLPGARRVIAGAEAKAVALGLKVNIAVVDDGGHLLAFERMDGARPASGYTALTKATTAATFRRPTGPLPNGSVEADPLLNLSLQNAAAVSGGKITTLLGGLPIEVDGQIIGAIGVGGGTGEQDTQVARAGVTQLAEDLTKSAPPAPESTAPSDNKNKF